MTAKVTDISKWPALGLALFCSLSSLIYLCWIWQKVRCKTLLFAIWGPSFIPVIFCNTAEYKWLDRTENLESLTLRKTPKMLISFHCKRYSWRFGRICIACFGTQVGAQNYGTYSWLHSLTQKTPLPKPTRNPNNKNYLVIFWWQPGSWTQVTGWGRSGGRRWSDPQEGHPRTALLDC